MMSSHKGIKTMTATRKTTTTTTIVAPATTKTKTEIGLPRHPFHAQTKDNSSTCGTGTLVQRLPAEKMMVDRETPAGNIRHTRTGGMKALPPTARANIRVRIREARGLVRATQHRECILPISFLSQCRAGFLFFCVVGFDFVLRLRRRSQLCHVRVSSVPGSFVCSRDG